MSFKKVFFLKYLNKFYKAFELELKNDGSIYVFLPGNTISEYGKNKMRKISIHSSGRINFESNPPHIIFIDPITRIKEPQFIVSAYIPKLTALGSEVLQPNDGYVIEIPFFNNLSLTVFLSELHDQKERLDNVISLNLSEIIYVFLTIFLYLLKCPQSLIL